MVFAACSSPEQRFATAAEELGYQYSIVEGTEFLHVIFKKGEAKSHLDLHIYLDGDGSPWLGNRWIATNPTPRNTLALDLMNLDPNPALYLGRPCYHGQSEEQPCSPSLWTDERYSKRVVISLASVLKTLFGQLEACRLVLIGYSGGGTLAMLLAEHLPQIHGIVTIAGNLAVGAWTQYHRYTPLIGSLDPALRPPLNPDIFQLHMVGAKDWNIPVELTRPIIRRQQNAEFLVYDDFSHRCCWEEVWPSVLKKIDRYPISCPGSITKPVS